MEPRGTELYEHSGRGYQVPQEHLDQRQQGPQYYAEGLEVVPPSEPEWVTGGPQDMAGMIPVSSEDGGKKDGHPFAGAAANVPDGKAGRPWWKRPLVLAVIAAAIIIAVGLGVGLGVGLTQGKNDESQSGNGEEKNNSDSNNSSGNDSTDDSSDGEADGKPPSCKDTLCPAILSVPEYLSKIHIIGRTADNRIALRTLDGSSWDPWFDVGETTGKLISQPTAMAWSVQKKYPRMDVIAVSSSQRRAFNRWYDQKESWAPPDKQEWAKLSPSIGSAIAACKIREDRLDFWAIDIDTGNITHTYWVDWDDDQIVGDGKDGSTGMIGQFWTGSHNWETQLALGQSRSAPAVVCRDSDVYHDIAYYGREDNALYHASFSIEDDWQTSDPWEGDWIGDPMLYVPPDDPERWEFFGVQKNNEMYHISWSSRDGGGYSSVNELGGKIISVPGVVSVDTGVVDIVALDIKGVLQHRHYDDDNGWSKEWESLGVRAHSAPTITAFDDKLFIAAVSESGNLTVWTRDNSVAKSWKGSLEENDLGGNMSLDFLTDDS